MTEKFLFFRVHWTEKEGREGKRREKGRKGGREERGKDEVRKEKNGREGQGREGRRETDTNSGCGRHKSYL